MLQTDVTDVVVLLLLSLSSLSLQSGALSSEEIAEALDLKGEIFKVSRKRCDVRHDNKLTSNVFPQQKRHWQLQPCSAVTGDGLVEGIDWMVKDIASRIFMMQ